MQIGMAMYLSKQKIVRSALNSVIFVCLVSFGWLGHDIWQQEHPETIVTKNVVTTVYRLKGDVNEDGKVDQVDLNIINQNMGATNPTYSMGDLNKDGVIDNTDLSIAVQWQGNGKPNVRLL
jgi:hypothetical protein